MRVCLLLRIHYRRIRINTTYFASCGVFHASGSRSVRQTKARQTRSNGQLINIDKHGRFSDLVTPCVDCNVFYVDIMTCHIDNSGAGLKCHGREISRRQRIQ